MTKESYLRTMAVCAGADLAKRIVEREDEMVITGAELVRLSGTKPFDSPIASRSLRTGEEVSA